MGDMSYYQELMKPDWAPPAEVFGPVWSVLYVLIGVTFAYVAYSYRLKRVPFRVLLPFLLNLAFNVAFTPIQFGLQSNILATIDVVLVLVTLVWALIVIYPYARWVVYANAPYVVWVFFATILQCAITYLNL